MERRKFLLGGMAITGLSAISFNVRPAPLIKLNAISRKKAAPLQPGACIAITAPGGAIFHQKYIPSFVANLNNLGYKVIKGETLTARHGQFAGKDSFRASELNGFFEDEQIDGIIAMRGGSGCSRILPLLNYDIIRSNPKVLMGYSDITTLLMGLYAQSGLVGFHGPVGYSTWNKFSTDHFLKVVARGEQITMHSKSDNETFRTIQPGKASGPFFGGNLTTLIHLLGTPYWPNTDGGILFVEEIDEEPYRIDRMLMHLKLSGVLDRLNGIVLGQFKRCEPEEPEKSLSLKQVVDSNLKPLNIPVFSGAHIGHVKDKFTLPIGINVVMDATKGSIQLQETPVQL